MKIIKIGNVELTEETVSKYYKENKYIVTYSAIWQIFYSHAQNQYYGNKIHIIKGIASRGRFYALSGGEINKILDKELLN